MRLGNRQAVLQPMRTLAAYSTHKSFILLDEYDFCIELPLFHSEREEPPLSTRNFSFFPPEWGGGGHGQKSNSMQKSYPSEISEIKDFWVE
jgi:hypothetical protein